MKKLAKLTALLLTGVMLLLLASCGAAPNPGGSSGLTAEEAKAKREIINAINDERKKAGKSSLREVQELTQLEQEFIEHFRKAGTKGIPMKDANQLEQELLKKQKNAGWTYYGGISFSATSVANDTAKLDSVYKGDTSEFRKELIDYGFATAPSTALSIGVVTIEGKIYWTASLLTK